MPGEKNWLQRYRRKNPLKSYLAPLLLCQHYSQSLKEEVPEGHFSTAPEARSSDNTAFASPLHCDPPCSRARRSDNENTMPFDWTEGALADGLRCYSNQEFFDAHEHWEGVWLKCDEPEKTFLQALIQITAAFHHLQRGNPVGTASLLRAALRRLEGYSTEYGGIAVEQLRSSIRAWLEAIRLDPHPPELTFPKIR